MRISAPLLSLLMLAVPAILGAQEATPRTFLTRLGQDTVMIDRFVLTPDRLSGTLVMTMPRVVVQQYEAQIAPTGQITRFQVTIRPGLTGSMPVTAWEAQLDNGALSIINRRETTDSVGFAVRSPSSPYLAAGVWQTLVNQARASGADSLPFDLYGPGSRQPQASYAARRGRDSVAVSFFGSELYLAVRPTGELIGVNASRTTQKFMTEPVADLDLDALVEQFVARERAGTIAGIPSPRDTTQAAVSGASLVIDYGRPFRRGREIFGGIVPFDEVWRTGANQATQFRSSADLLVGQTRIPAGSYTLWTLPTRDGVTLIVNRQTGQWGTQYDAAQDLVRLPMRVETLPRTVEQFTITVAPRDGGGVLQFDWDRTRWTLPFTVVTP